MIVNKPDLKNYLASLVFLVIAVSLFYPVWHFQYLDYDDQLYIIADSATKQLNLANLKAIFLEPYATSWYPLTRLSHAIEYIIFGDNPAGTHLVNVLLHYLNTVIFFHVLLRVGKLTYPDEKNQVLIQHAAFFASVLFIVHPQHLEAVAWAVQRKELLATTFAFLSITLYFKRKLFWTGVFVTLAMLSKASTVVLPAFFILFEITSIESKGVELRQLVRVVWTNRWFLLLALAIAAITFMHHQAGGALFYEEQFSLLTRLMLFADNVLRGLYHFFTLQPELFQLPISEYVIDASWLGYVVLAIAATLFTACGVLILSGTHASRIGAMGLLFYFTALLPVGGLIVFGNYAFGDRYMYFSSVGIYLLVFICLCGIFQKFSRKAARRWLNLALVIVVLAAFFQSQRVLPKWATTESIWLYELERRPDSVLANYLLGQHYFFNDRHELAYSYFEAATLSRSNYFKKGARTASALFMAEISCKAGKGNQAIDVLKKIPKFGGNSQDIEMLIETLRYEGYDACARKISDWYKPVTP